MRQGASPRNEASPGRAPRAIGSLGSGHFVARNHARTFLAKPLRNLATQVVDLGVQGPASRRNFFLLARQLLKALCELLLVRCLGSGEPTIHSLLCQTLLGVRK